VICFSIVPVGLRVLADFLRIMADFEIAERAHFYAVKMKLCVLQSQYRSITIWLGRQRH
jgi:hypothetical protein